MNKMSKIAVRDNEFYLPTDRESRKLLLKQYISTKLTDEWLKQPKQKANLERRFLRKLIDSL